MKIFCVACDTEIEAVKTDGKEIYPHRSDLSDKQFWKCETCNNYVGCHSGTGNNGEPLGCIPTAELRKARMEVHDIIDPLWRSGKFPRGKVYSEMRKSLGYEYHSGETKTIEECAKAKSAALLVKSGLVV